MSYRSRADLIEEATSLGLEVPEDATRAVLFELISEERETGNGGLVCTNCGQPAEWESLAPRASKIYYCHLCYRRYGKEPMSELPKGWTAQQDRKKSQETAEAAKAEAPEEEDDLQYDPAAIREEVFTSPFLFQGSGD